MVLSWLITIKLSDLWRTQFVSWLSTHNASRGYTRGALATLFSLRRTVRAVASKPVGRAQLCLRQPRLRERRRRSAKRASSAMALDGAFEW